MAWTAFGWAGLLTSRTAPTAVHLEAFGAHVLSVITGGAGVWSDFGWHDIPSHVTPLDAVMLEAFGEYIYDLATGTTPPETFTVTLTALFTGGTTDQPLTYDADNTRFHPGALVPE